MQFIDAFENPDACSTLLLICALYVVGDRLVQERPQLRERGIQIAVAVFVAFWAYECWASGARSAAEYLGVVIQALVVAAIALGASWIALRALAPLLSMAALPARMVDRARRRADAKRIGLLQSAERERQFAAQLRQQDAERSRAQAAFSVQRRRVDARAKAELTYSLFAPRLGDRFTAGHLSEYLRKYMGDEQPPEDVERRGTELVSTLQQHLEHVDPPGQKRTLDELANWHAEHKQLIERLPIDAKLQRMLLAELNGRHVELCQKLLAELEP
jgi:hypothetical protein